MNYLKNSTFLKSKTENGMLIYLIFIVVVWIAYYLKCFKFGMYEDDYWIVGIPANSSFEELMDFIKSQITNHIDNRGRYIAATFPLLVTYFNYQIGGFAMLYLFGIFLVALNGFLIFKIIRKNFPFELALLTGLLFLIYPGDTTKSMLVHIYHLQISLAFTLAGMLYYVNGRKIVGYILAFLSMLDYENAFLPFTLVPLLVYQKWDRILIQKLFVHWLIIGIYVIILYLTRRIGGEILTSSTSTGELFYNTFKALVLGPLTACASFFWAPANTLIHFRATYYAVFLAVLVLLILCRIYPSLIKAGNIPVSLFGSFKQAKAIDDRQIMLLKAAAIGIVFTVVGYAFGFSHSPTVLMGRSTSVHLGGSFGISFLFASVISLVIITGNNNFFHKYIKIPVLMIFIALLAGYGMIIQNDYIKSWNIQKLFWKSIVKDCPDVKDNTVILVKRNNIVETEYAISHSWACPIILENLYYFPEEWNQDPRVYVMHPDISAAIIRTPDSLLYIPYNPMLEDFHNQVLLEDGNVILLDMNEHHELRRIVDSTWTINGITIYLKPVEYAPALDRSFKKKNINAFMLDK